jgi:hypothetical protein
VTGGAVGGRRGCGLGRLATGRCMPFALMSEDLQSGEQEAERISEFPGMVAKASGRGAVKASSPRNRCKMILVEPVLLWYQHTTMSRQRNLKRRLCRSPTLGHRVGGYAGLTEVDSRPSANAKLD